MNNFITMPLNLLPARILAIVFLFSYSLNFGKNRQPDSLLQLLKSNTIQDSARVNILIALGTDYHNRGFLAERSLTQAIELAHQIHYSSGEGRGLKNLGGYYFDLANYPVATECYIKALKIFTDNNQQAGIASCYNCLGLISLDLKDYQKAADYYVKAITILKKISLTKNSKSIQNSLAITHEMLGLLFLENKQYANALKNLAESVRINLKNDFNMNVTYVNMASYYIETAQADSAIKYIHLADSSYRSNNNGYGVYWVSMLLGEVDLLSGDYNKAKEHLEFSYSYATINKDAELLNVVMPVLIKTYKLLEKYKEAFLVQEKMNHFIDSLKGSEISNKVKMTEYQYQQQEKELMEKEEKKKRQIVNYGLAVIFTIVAFFTLFLFNRFLVIRKQKQIIEDQKSLVDKAYEKLHEKNKEVIDSINYASRIQKALITSDKYIAAQLRRLMGNNA